MRNLLYASVALLGLAASGAYAQTTAAPAGAPPAGRGVIVPPLPAASVGANATPQQYLQAAQTALDHRQTGQARDALEQAETRLLDRSVAPSMAGQPDQNPAIKNIGDAREAIRRGDLAGAKQSITEAMNATTAGTPDSSMPSGSMPSGSMPSGSMPGNAMGAGGSGMTAPSATGGMPPQGGNTGANPGSGSNSNNGGSTGY
jgi:hypothetical protein